MSSLALGSMSIALSEDCREDELEERDDLDRKFVHRCVESFPEKQIRVWGFMFR